MIIQVAFESIPIQYLKGVNRAIKNYLKILMPNPIVGPHKAHVKLLARSVSHFQLLAAQYMLFSGYGYRTTVPPFLPATKKY